MQGNVTAHGFPADLDGHPALAWMGPDWVHHLTVNLLTELQRQDPATVLHRVGCTGAPQLEVGASEDGSVQRVALRVPVEIAVTDGDGREHQLEGLATCQGPEPALIAFELGTPHERLAKALRDARELVSRPGNDFMWSSFNDAHDAVAELDELLATSSRRPLRRADLGGLFAPTGPLHEVAVSSGWTAAFDEVADRVEAIRLDLRRRWWCDRCGAFVGIITLFEDGTLRRDTFTGRLERRAARAEIEPLSEALVAGDSAAVHALDRELAPWWCPECAAVYCADEWQRWDTFDDEGFHEDIRGRCPEGHERMLED